jgi:hypothetical protein
VNRNDHIVLHGRPWQLYGIEGCCKMPWFVEGTGFFFQSAVWQSAAQPQQAHAFALP